MGCWSVACSVSKLTINSGDRVVFIPLIPSDENIRNYPGHEHHLVGKQSHLVYSNCFFNPLTFPIRGHYNDYGGLEDIDDDANTKAIEKYFGMSAPDFIDTVERNYCREYLSDQKKIIGNLVKNTEDFNSCGKNRDKLTKAFMKKMGFTIGREGDYSFKEFPYKIVIRKGIETEEGHSKGRQREGYEIVSTKTNEVVKKRPYNGFYRNYLLADFVELTKYYIGVPEEYQKKVHLMEQLSGMYILEEVYEYLAAKYTRANCAPGSLVLEELGFVVDPKRKDEYYEKDKFYYHPEVEDSEAYLQISEYGSPKLFDKSIKSSYGKYVESTVDLAENYIANHGVVLDLTPLEGVSVYLTKFNKVSGLYRNYLDFQDMSREERIAKAKEDGVDVESDAYLDYIFCKNPLGYDGGREMHSFKDWQYLEDIYGESFKDKSVSKVFCDWVAASGEMASANTFYFPAVCGEQHGNDPVSKDLLKKSLAILEDRERVYREENCCPDCGSEDCVCNSEEGEA